MTDLFQERRQYSETGIDVGDLNPDPFIELKNWIELAVSEQILDATAMVISTVDANLRPDSRVVLLKDVTDQQLLFFTDYNSVKGQQLIHNHHVAVNFHWATMERQIRVRGSCAKTPRDVSEAYFASRPLGSQCAAIVSEQSSEISSRELLVQAYDKLLTTPDKISCPAAWGGYAITPFEFEFYKGRSNRLNDRIRYTLHDDAWERTRVAP